MYCCFYLGKRLSFLYIASLSELLTFCQNYSLYVLLFVFRKKVSFRSFISACTFFQYYSLHILLFVFRKNSCLDYIAPWDEPWPLNQSELNEQRRLVLKGGLAPTSKKRLTGGPTRASTLAPKADALACCQVGPTFRGLSS
jgi:hypothetical protein